MREATRRSRRRWRRPLLATLAGATVLSLAGGGVALALAGRSGDRYTTATAALGSVEQTVSAAGTVASATRRDVSFPVDGTVASVLVRLGDTVTAGQVLASLDPTSLQDALDAANQALQQAQQRLSDDLESQTATSSSSSSSGSSPSSSDTGTGDAGPSDTGDSPSTPDVTRETQAVAAAQQALLARYDEARAALGTSTQALADAQAACADLGALDPTTVVPDPTPTPTPTPTATSEEPGAIAPTSSDVAGEEGGGGTTVSGVQAMLATCQTAIAGASDAQTATGAAQDAVTEAAAALDAAVAALQDALRAGSSPTGPSDPTTPIPDQEPTATPTPTPTATSEQSGVRTPASSDATGGGGATGTPASAEDILADRAAIDAAQAQVDIATHDLSLVNLTSPIAGTIAAVSIAAGDRVSASSDTAVITVLGGDGHVVNLTVPLTSIDALEVGQPATVSVPSAAQPLTGTVSSIGVLDVSETSTPEYEVVVALDPTSEPLFDGSSAQVEIAVAGTGEVLTVPTSAVHVDGTTATVQVLADGTVTDVTVERGAVGAELTEIVSGLTEGQTVVLADRARPLDTGGSDSSSGLSGLTDKSGATERHFVGGGGPMVDVQRG